MARDGHRCNGWDGKAWDGIDDEGCTRWDGMASMRTREASRDAPDGIKQNFHQITFFKSIFNQTFHKINSFFFLLQDKFF